MNSRRRPTKNGDDAAIVPLHAPQQPVMLVNERADGVRTLDGQRELKERSRIASPLIPFSYRGQREASMRKSRFFFAATAALTILSSAAIAQQAMTSGVVTKVDEPHGTIRIQYGQPGTVGGTSVDTSEDFKVKDGLLFNALQAGDKVQFSVDQADGAKTITKLEKQ
jgi:Cu/Ag efflux protein CusF